MGRGRHSAAASTAAPSSTAGGGSHRIKNTNGSFEDEEVSFFEPYVPSSSVSAKAAAAMGRHPNSNAGTPFHTCSVFTHVTDPSGLLVPLGGPSAPAPSPLLLASSAQSAHSFNSSVVGAAAVGGAKAASGRSGGKCADFAMLPNTLASPVVCFAGVAERMAALRAAVAGDGSTAVSGGGGGGNRTCNMYADPLLTVAHVDRLFSAPFLSKPLTVLRGPTSAASPSAANESIAAASEGGSAGLNASLGGGAGMGMGMGGGASALARYFASGLSANGEDARRLLGLPPTNASGGGAQDGGVNITPQRRRIHHTHGAPTFLAAIRNGGDGHQTTFALDTATVGSSGRRSALRRGTSPSNSSAAAVVSVVGSHNHQSSKRRLFVGGGGDGGGYFAARSGSRTAAEGALSSSAAATAPPPRHQSPISPALLQSPSSFAGLQPPPMGGLLSAMARGAAATEKEAATEAAAEAAAAAAARRSAAVSVIPKPPPPALPAATAPVRAVSGASQLGRRLLILWRGERPSSVHSTANGEEGEGAEDDALPQLLLPIAGFSSSSASPSPPRALRTSTLAGVSTAAAAAATRLLTNKINAGDGRAIKEGVASPFRGLSSPPNARRRPPSAQARASPTAAAATAAAASVKTLFRKTSMKYAFDVSAWEMAMAIAPNKTAASSTSKADGRLNSTPKPTNPQKKSANSTANSRAASPSSAAANRYVLVARGGAPPAATHRKAPHQRHQQPTTNRSAAAVSRGSSGGSTTTMTGSSSTTNSMRFMYANASPIALRNASSNASLNATDDADYEDEKEEAIAGKRYSAVLRAKQRAAPSAKKRSTSADSSYSVYSSGSYSSASSAAAASNLSSLGVGGGDGATTRSHRLRERHTRIVIRNRRAGSAGATAASASGGPPAEVTRAMRLLSEGASLAHIYHR